MRAKIDNESFETAKDAPLVNANDVPCVSFIVISFC